VFALQISNVEVEIKRKFLSPDQNVRNFGDLGDWVTGVQM